MKRTLSLAQVDAIEKLRAQVDDWGDPKLSMREVAEIIGCSESTVARALKRTAGYKKPTTDMEVQDRLDRAAKLIAAGGSMVTLEEAKASQARFTERLRKEGMEVPASPLAGGDAPAETEGEGLTHLKRAVSSQVLLDQIKGEKE